MTDQHVVCYNPDSPKLEIPEGGNRYLMHRPVIMTQTLDTTGLVNGRNLTSDGDKLDQLTITDPVDMTAIQVKVGFMNITQTVDLDAVEARVEALATAVVLKGSWDASTFLFPTSTVAGETWICSVAGSAGGITFALNDRVTALVDGASASVYTGQWIKTSYASAVTSVAGRVGDVVLVAADISDLADMVTADGTVPLTAAWDAGDFVIGAGGLTLKAQGTPIAHTPGLIQYSPDGGGNFSAYVEESDITLNIGEEGWKTVRNDTGLTIADGTPVYITDYLSGIPQVAPAMADGYEVIGLTTHSLEAGTVGKVTHVGNLTGPDLTAYSNNDTLYVSPTVAGELTNVAPLWPTASIIVGHVADNSDPGKLDVHVDHRGSAGVTIKSYNFSARNASSGQYYLGGFYDASPTDANLTQASTTATHGTANSPYGAHAFIVFGAAATDGSTITLTASGTSFDEVTGTLTPGDSEVLYTGAAAGLTLNDYIETPKKWNGTVTFTLTSDGVNFSMDFNYGLAKYDDFGDVDVVMRLGEVVGLAEANDSNFEVELIRHTAAGWTYLASGFDNPGSAARYSMVGDYGANGIFDGEHFAWKRTNLIVPLSAALDEGLILRVVTSVNNAVAYMNVHVGVVAV